VTVTAATITATQSRKRNASASLRRGLST
jgi:hypothetical protein